MNSTQKGSLRATVIRTLQRIVQGSCSEIERRAGIPEGGSRPILKELRAEGLARICEWDQPGGRAPHAVWSLGSGPDAERPLPKGRGSRAKPVEADSGAHRDLPMDYPVKTVFAGGVNPWIGVKT